MSEILDRSEWDFPPDLHGQELTACYIYEFARESVVLQTLSFEVGELCSNEYRDSTKIPPKPRITLKGKRITYQPWRDEEVLQEILNLISECDENEVNAIRRFAERVKSYKAERERQRNLPHITDIIEEIVKNRGITESDYAERIEYIIRQSYFPSTPWQKLTEDERQRQIPSGYYTRPIHPASDVDLHAVQEAIPDCTEEVCFSGGFSIPFCQPYFINNDGVEIRPFKIDWFGATNAEIIDTFAEWVSKRRDQIGIEQPKHRKEYSSRKPSGRGKVDADIRSHLYCLGIMRILHTCPIEKVRTEYPDAYIHWIDHELEKRADIFKKNRDFYMRGTRFLDAVLGDEKGDGDVQMTVRQMIINERRGAAKRIFKKLFPFEKSNPASWSLASRV